MLPAFHFLIFHLPSENFFAARAQIGATFVVLFSDQRATSIVKESSNSRQSFSFEWWEHASRRRRRCQMKKRRNYREQRITLTKLIHTRKVVIVWKMYERTNVGSKAFKVAFYVRLLSLFSTNFACSSRLSLKEESVSQVGCEGRRERNRRGRLTDSAAWRKWNFCPGKQLIRSISFRDSSGHLYCTAAERWQLTSFSSTDWTKSNLNPHAWMV